MTENVKASSSPVWNGAMSRFGKKVCPLTAAALAGVSCARTWGPSSSVAGL